ncbi:hypothetical protein RZS08_13805, partial [Arthrospira platensis SPKY1]|nr:hypothetical protein [Arthrospira platensis SPKY1]
QSAAPGRRRKGCAAWRSSSRGQRPQAGFVQHGHAELLRLVQLAACLLARHQVVGAAADGAGDFAAVGLDERPRLVARPGGQRAGNHEGQSVQRDGLRLRAGGGELETGRAQLFQHGLVARPGKPVHHRQRRLRADAFNLLQRLRIGGGDGVQAAE